MGRSAQARDLERLVGRALALEDEAARQSVDGVVSVLMEMHRRGLAQVLALAATADADGPALVERLASDPEIGPLLLLHDLHPVALATRVQDALEGTRPYLQAGGGDAELVGVEPGGRVHVRLHGSHGDAQSVADLRSTVAVAIFEAVPDVTDLVVDDPASETEEPAVLPATELPPVVTPAAGVR